MKEIITKNNWTDKLKKEIQRYSKKNVYEAIHFKTSICECGNKKFLLDVDDREGVAVRTCSSCNAKKYMLDSIKYMDNADLEWCACPCGNDKFELMIGVALYKDSLDVKWTYIGCHCSVCQLSACYADWKSEYTNYEKYLEMV